MISEIFALLGLGRDDWERLVSETVAIVFKEWAAILAVYEILLAMQRIEPNQVTEIIADKSLRPDPAPQSRLTVMQTLCDTAKLVA